MAFIGNIEFEALNFATRLWSFSLAFWVLIITYSYTANMASFLVARNTKYGEITSMEQATLKKAPVCLLGQTNTDEWFNRDWIT